MRHGDRRIDFSGAFAPAVVHLSADQSRPSIRIGALLILAAATSLAFALGGALLRPGPPGNGLCTLGPASLGIGLVIAWLGERLLRRRWPSGNWVEIFPGGIRFQHRGEIGEIAFDRPVEAARWRFRLGDRIRRGLHPTGWECYAVRLVQDRAALSLYGFLPPRAALELSSRLDFHLLPDHTDKNAALKGPHTAYLAAERLRAAEGMELEAADFVRVVGILERFQGGTEPTGPRNLSPL